MTLAPVAHGHFSCAVCAYSGVVSGAPCHLSVERLTRLLKWQVFRRISKVLDRMVQIEVRLRRA